MPSRLAFGRFAAPIVFLLVSAATASDRVDFNQDIRPLLSNNCLMCHGPDEEERAAGLRLDTQDGSREDLGGYAAVTPGDPDASALLERAISDDEDLRMPPEGKGKQLTDDEVKLVRRWIEQGGDYAKHWSYLKPTRPELPKVKQSTWPQNAIDYFTLARLESRGLRPSPAAQRMAIARRVSLDLIGLPPTWDEAHAFTLDPHPDAYEKFVDALLAKQAFGERWARVWLDLARYADSAGYADDRPRTIWAYRDYVIQSLNENKPFDQFTIEQIAGDLLEDPSDEQLIATAFHRNTLTNNEGGTNDEEFRNVAVVDRVNTTMAVWMGTTIACAQCHTHKYDPITHDEYFKFFAIFNNSQDTDQRDERPLLEIWDDDHEQRKEQLRTEIADLKKTLAKPTPDVAAAQIKWLKQVSTQPAWTTIQPTSAKAITRELSINDDGWITADGDKPVAETYTLEFDPSPKKLTGLRIETSDAQKSNFVVSKVQAVWQPYQRQPVLARFVRVELPGKNKILHLTEIQAFSEDENIASQGKASQSSTGFGGLVKFVNDGENEGQFCHTNEEKNPWVEIDLGDAKPLNQIVVWNRMDGNESIRNRLKGYKVQLLDDSREIVWEHSPAEIPAPSSEFSLTGEQPLQFVAAFADHAQNGFPASKVLTEKVDIKSGWAIAPETGKPHELTLLLKEPIDLGAGKLVLKIHQNSIYPSHLIDQFRISITTDEAKVHHWAKMPTKARELVTAEPSAWTDADRKTVTDYYLSVSPLLTAKRNELKRKEKTLANIKPRTTVPIMRQVADDKRRTTNVQIRGNYLSKGNEVTEGTPEAFHPLPSDRDPDRLALARWLVDEENPLTARVIANRHWEQLFGTGIVETSEEFGSQGELPSHPQLLDWLAVELQESGWDLKRFLKLIVMSATYRQSSVTNSQQQANDPFNRMFARGPRFRVSAEMVRDQALFVSGLLSEKMYGRPVHPPQPNLGLKAAFGSATDWKTSDGTDKYRRGLYTTWRRSSPYPSMAQFDAPNREVCTVRRIRTNTPLQALVTLNDPVFVEAAQALARRTIEHSDSVAQRIQFAIRTCLIREPTEREVTRLTQLAGDAYQRFSDSPDQAKQMATDPLGDLPDDADVAEYAAWTVVGNVILNLDEIFMKR